jgi:hypothetical protein
MAKDKIMQHLAPADRTGTELKGPDQAAAEAKVRMHERHHAPGPIEGPFDFDAQERDWHAVRKIEKRMGHGGSTFRQGDGLG